MALPTSVVIKELKILLDKTSYVMTVTLKLSIYFFLDCQLTSTLSSMTIKRKVNMEGTKMTKQEPTTNAIFMVNLSPVGSINDDMVEPHYDSDILSEVPHYDTFHDSDMLNSNIQELGYIENIVSNNKSYDELTSNSNVISYTDYMLTIGNDDDNYVPPPV
ncbi:hypothetical protein Tco_1211403 [Tanacetum coccineum]